MLRFFACCVFIFQGTASGKQPDIESVDDPTSGDFSKFNDVAIPETIVLKTNETYLLHVQIAKQTIAGKTFKRYAYNGSIPGPLFKVKQGTKTKVTLVNDTDIPTSLHSHGLRLNYLFDGAVGLGRKAPVAPGARFDYELFFPDAGIFWYHPHVREDYSQDMGLAGNFVVEPKEVSFWGAADNEKSSTNDVHWVVTDASGRENIEVNWKLKKGDLARVTIENPESSMHPMQHPIHFHGQRFLVESINGKTVKNKA